MPTFYLCIYSQTNKNIINQWHVSIVCYKCIHTLDVLFMLIHCRWIRQSEHLGDRMCWTFNTMTWVYFLIIIIFFLFFFYITAGWNYSEKERIRGAYDFKDVLTTLQSKFGIFPFFKVSVENRWVCVCVAHEWSLVVQYFNHIICFTKCFHQKFTAVRKYHNNIGRWSWSAAQKILFQWWYSR